MTASGTPLVHILDDDAGIREALLRLCNADGLEARTHETAAGLIASLDTSRQTCILLDMQLLDDNGLNVQERIVENFGQVPIIFMTGYGTIPLTVRAMRAGAVEFLTKPIDADALLDSVRAALEGDLVAAAARAHASKLRSDYEQLTAREREVLGLIIGGLMNKQIAAELGTAEVTAKVHKRRVMEKLGARSVADLIQIADKLDIVATRRR